MLNFIMDLFSQKSPINVWYGSECVSSFHSITNTERKLTGLPWVATVWVLLFSNMLEL